MGCDWDAPKKQQSAALKQPGPPYMETAKLTINTGVFGCALAAGDSMAITGSLDIKVLACKLYASYQHIRRACLCIQECF